jgi:hypothetical protein
MRAAVCCLSCVTGANLFHGNRIELELPRRRTLTARDLAMLFHTLDQSFEQSLIHCCQFSFNDSRHRS